MTALEKTLSVGMVVMLAYVGFSVFFYLKEESVAEKTLNAMKHAKMLCPEGTEERIDYWWGESGYSRSCVNLKNGKWEAWGQGYKHIDGYYKEGKQHGVWSFFKEDGTLYKTIEFENGVEVGHKSNHSR